MKKKKNKKKKEKNVIQRRNFRSVRDLLASLKKIPRPSSRDRDQFSEPKLPNAIVSEKEKEASPVKSAEESERKGHVYYQVVVERRSRTSRRLTKSKRTRAGNENQSNPFETAFFGWLRSSRR